MNTRPLVVIEDALVRSMAADQRYLNAFPFLEGLRQKLRGRTGRGCCGRKSASDRELAASVNAAKVALANMAPEKKRELLRLMNAHSVRLTYNDGTRVVTRTVEPAVAVS